MIQFLLNNKKKIPSIGYGTFRLPDNNDTTNLIKLAIKNGYRHFDTASSYGNEKSVGKGFKSANINREDLFITGKLWNDDRGYNNIIEACKKSINNLGCEYLDLYLIHWPASPALYNNWQDINNETWSAMEYLYKEGLVKAIGVCNFKVSHLEALIKFASIKPMVNQIEFHPGQIQKDIVDFCKKNGILVEAWGPLGSGKMLKKEVLKEVAEKYNTTVAELCINFCLQNNVLPLCKSLAEEEMIMNLNTQHFTISEEDMKYLNELPYIGGSGLDSDTLTLFN